MTLILCECGRYFSKGGSLVAGSLDADSLSFHKCPHCGKSYTQTPIAKMLTEQINQGMPIAFQCQRCGRALYPQKTISDGCSGDPEDYEGKHIVEMRCPVHNWEYKRRCDNCNRQGLADSADPDGRSHICANKTSDTFGKGVKDWLNCAAWVNRKQFYVKPVCYYCRDYKTDKLFDAYHCINSKSPSFNVTKDFRGAFYFEACPHFHSRNTIAVRAKYYKERIARIIRWKIRNPLQRRWGSFKQRFNIELEFEQNDEPACEDCKYAKEDRHVKFKLICMHKSSEFYQKDELDRQFGNCPMWKTRYSKIRRAKTYLKYYLTGHY